MIHYLFQLDEAKRPEDHNKEDPNNQPDVKSEENAIEMSEDFDAKVQDLEDVDKEKNDEEDDGGDEEEIDKQMGDVDDADNDKLDEQMWGSDEEDNGDEVGDNKPLDLFENVGFFHNDIEMCWLPLGDLLE